MRLQFLPVVFGLAAMDVSAYPSNSFQDKCAGLAKDIHLDYPFTVNIAQYLPPNATIDLHAEGRNLTCDSYYPSTFSVEVGICRFNLKVETTNSSEIYVEVWLPEKWEGRVLSTGNGGLAGCIDYVTVSYGASQGFASIGANGGHNGTSAGAFYNQPEVIEDFSWRSVYVGTVVGKSLVKQFYGKDSRKSYYVGCSQGGRQGWKAIQKTPDIFDGVIAGAPAVDIYAHLSYFAYIYQTLGQNANNTLVTMPQWAAVQAAALQQCDDLDGAHDGIIEDPRACTFDWTAVSCATNSTAPCLTPEQIATASKLFAPVTYNGTTIHPTGQAHGYETALFTWTYFDFVQVWVPETFRYLVYNDLSWDPATFTLEDAYHALRTNRVDMGTTNPDISAFRDRGGKVLHWHGANDPLLSIGTSDTYYASVQKHLNATTAELDSFYRYFRPSGVLHCSGGPGANIMGQIGQYVSGAGAEDNMITRIVEWVEEGKAPDFVRGTKFVDDVVGGEVLFRRKHCKVPLVNVYKGKGNGTDEEGWECVERY
ncbi:putative feruloyl esterase [Byssothecium circinans]|uniref:Carboxylic ester hydrolase n=1 Tax=Byssothecium circinans TaxID=147558 RepID=A0A6A5TP91_9PLEO|nr:putative feruloyl esterase [Byssothecium circinans]